MFSPGRPAEPPARGWLDRSPRGWLDRVLQTEPHERAAVGWAAVAFCLLLCSLYVVRPLRDAMGIAAGVEQMQWLFTGTFVGIVALVPVIGWAASRVSRVWLVAGTYVFMAITMLALQWADAWVPAAHARWVARVIFVWVSIYNMVALSLFWSLMSDLFTPGQASRLFGVVAAGGTVGALTGPLVATLVSSWLEPILLLPITAGLLVVAAMVAVLLERAGRAARGTDAPSPSPLGGSLWAGLRLVVADRQLRGIALYVLAMTWAATVLYFEQARVVDEAVEGRAARTSLFARMDLAVNVLALAIQLLLTGRLFRRLGLGWVLIALPLASGLSLFGFGVMPTLTVIVVIQVLRRAVDFSLSKPAREVLFTPVSREAKYKGKNAIDTVVYRGGDAIAGWLFALLQSVGTSLGAIAWASLPIVVAWAGLAVRLGRRHEDARVSEASPDGPPDRA